jgi:ABC-2 type transport system permease protein
MQEAELTWYPFLTLLKKEIMRFMRVIGQTVITPIINSSLYLLIFGLSLGGSVRLSNGMSYLAFLIPGLVMMSALNNAYQNSSSSIVTSKFHGDLQDMRTMPLTPLKIVWAMALGGLIRGLLVASLTLTVSEVFHFISAGEIWSVQNPFLFLFFLCIGCLCFSLLGISVGFKATSFEKVNAVGSFVLLPLLYLGGVFFSISGLHPFWQSIARVNPLLYLINGLRYAAAGQSDVPIEWSFCVALAAFLFMFTIATRSVRNGSFTRW